jgi:hypothetical protein
MLILENADGPVGRLNSALFFSDDVLTIPKVPVTPGFSGGIVDAVTPVSSLPAEDALCIVHETCMYSHFTRFKIL